MAGAPWSPLTVGVMAGAFANLEQPQKAEPLLDHLRSDAYGGPVGLSCYHLARGDRENAIEWAGRAADQRFTCLITWVIRSFEPQLRRSAAWPALLRKMNLV